MILIIQFRKDNSGHHEVKCLHNALAKDYTNYTIVNAYGDLDSKDLIYLAKRSRGIILGGNGESGYEEVDLHKIKTLEAVINKMKDFLKEVERLQLPTLGICFGHQLIADYLGGNVFPDKNQAETGVNKIILTEYGIKDRLFKGLEKEFYSVLSHKSSVVSLNNKAVKILAYSNKCNIQAFQYKNFYGTQFHPELSIEDFNHRIKMYPEYMEYCLPFDENINIDVYTLMHNFWEIVNKSNN